MDNKIKRIPIKPSQIKKNTLGPLHVACQVSQRYLQFQPDSYHCQAGEFITVDVMTELEDDKSRKLCSLILTREDLLAALENINAQNPNE